MQLFYSFSKKDVGITRIPPKRFNI